MTDTYPYTLLQPEHRLEMAAWLEDGQQPANTTLRAAITAPRAAGNLVSGLPAHPDPLVREVCYWLYNHAPKTAWGYQEALSVWPNALANMKPKPETGVAT